MLAVLTFIIPMLWRGRLMNLLRFLEIELQLWALHNFLWGLYVASLLMWLLSVSIDTFSWLIMYRRLIKLTVEVDFQASTVLLRTYRSSLPVIKYFFGSAHLTYQGSIQRTRVLWLLLSLGFTLATANQLLLRTTDLCIFWIAKSRGELLVVISGWRFKLVKLFWERGNISRLFACFPWIWIRFVILIELYQRGIYIRRNFTCSKVDFTTVYALTRSKWILLTPLLHFEIIAMSGTHARVVDAAQRRNIPTALRVAQAASRVTGHHKLSGKSKGSVRRDTPHTGTSL